ncbi:hypothetical protein MIC448_550005 [Microbacterium sp. C448]|nr:hypothetical protein MIC448_550005 [Microbacterium sp. C448]
MPGDRGGTALRNLRVNETPGSLCFLGGPCRDRTDDIHGVNVALYQLS